MKEIKVFLASSEELKYDRLAFSDLIRKLDNIYEKRGIRIRLFQWEDFDAAYNDKRKQDEYNEYIKQSDLFLALFRTKAGEFTVEEFELARDEHREKGLPKPHVYCRDLEQGETEDKTLTEFKQRLFDEMGHFFARYKNEDGLNLHFVMQLQLFENSRSEQVETDGNLITFCGEPIAKTDNIDFFAKNKDFIRMREDLKDLNADIEDLRLRQASAPEDENLKNRIQEKLNKRNALQEEFEHYRKQILRIERQIIELQGQEINEAVKRAMEAFAEGEVNKADIILSEATQGVAQRREEYIEHKKTGEQMRKNLLADIDALLLKAETVLSNTEKTIEERISEALNAYREADKTAILVDYTAKEYIRLLFGYSNFLRTYAYYEESENIYLRLISLCESTYGKNEITGTAYDNLGSLYYDLHKDNEALNYYQKSFEIINSREKPDNKLLSNCMNNIANVLGDLGNYNKALEYHTMSLKISKEEFGEISKEVSISLRNIGSIYQKMRDPNKALELFQESLEIEEKISKDYSIGKANCNLKIGDLFLFSDEIPDAIKHLGFAIIMYKELLGESHPDLAECYESIAACFAKFGSDDTALEYLNKALEIIENTFGHYHKKTGELYYNLADCYINKEDYIEAKDNFNIALDIFTKVCEPENEMLLQTKESLEYVEQLINKPKKKGFWSSLFGE